MRRKVVKEWILAIRQVRDLLDVLVAESEKNKPKLDWKRVKGSLEKKAISCLLFNCQ